MDKIVILHFVSALHFLHTYKHEVGVEKILFDYTSGDKDKILEQFRCLSCRKRRPLGENTLNHRGILQDKLYFCGMIKN
ncbi:hypothetical protein JN06_00053 [Bacteroides zoogleoformans]|uniref:Uncharacterized protein n=1 Tax=Bacteroides zoogleoformans TaxID=28119 RepID=A0ABM6T896_9BACE|nr:hypothetical protein [Bacteroides zoogleoformans]AVM52986.1 hypothetical protein C4H11_08595 [Bacteroides zoogleoformans]TWJ18466.1 hypothetical protein JN06_00053 [Bacteroides zoogleoformans]